MRSGGCSAQASARTAPGEGQRSAASARATAATSVNSLQGAACVGHPGRQRTRAATDRPAGRPQARRVAREAGGAGAGSGACAARRAPRRRVAARQQQQASESQGCQRACALCAPGDQAGAQCSVRTIKHRFERWKPLECPRRAAPTAAKECFGERTTKPVTQKNALRGLRALCKELHAATVHAALIQGVLATLKAAACNCLHG